MSSEVLKKPLPIGIEFYKEIIDRPYYYADKTMMIKELLDKGGKITLFTRPRRFGKTLALTMLKTFFEQETTFDGSVLDNRRYFEGMAIMDTGEAYTGQMGNYPVIFLSLKSAKQPTWEMAAFIRSLFESAFKTNECLEFAVITGCLRISRESIFTGLNNLKANSVLDHDFAEYFGFTQPETDAFPAQSAFDTPHASQFLPCQC